MAVMALSVVNNKMILNRNGNIINDDIWHGKWKLMIKINNNENISLSI